VLIPVEEITQWNSAWHGHDQFAPVVVFTLPSAVQRSAPALCPHIFKEKTGGATQSVFDH